MRFFGQYLKGFPIFKVDTTDREQLRLHDEISLLVERILDLHKQLQKSGFESEREPIKRQIEATDRKIDELVYALYGLSEEEIRVVEGK